MTGAVPALRRRRDWGETAKPLVLRLGLLVLIIAAWQWVGDDGAPIRMPTFTRTVRSFWEMVVSGELPAALLESNVALFWGYLLALSIAVPLGIAMGLVGIVRRVVSPYLLILLSTPLIAVLPVLQTIFGLGLGTRIVVVFIFSFVYIAFNTMVGVLAVPADLLEMSSSFCATRRQRLLKVVLPHAFPAIMAGARIGLGRGVVGMVIAELFLVSSGLGSSLAFYMTRFDSGSVLAIALTMVLEGVVVIAVARRIEAAFRPKW